ncbi:MAG: class I SAM-dependent methyltransferase [Xanthomonadales bacterium]|nr:class I SAM-dependent methyltransferase [Xanthomonadales bacterium]
MNKDARFWDKRAEKYSQRPVSDEETYEKKLEITRGYFRPDSEVLEIGCGTGSTALAHAPYVKHVLATDISPAMINIAKDKARAGQVENITFEVRAAGDCDIPESRYDVIMAHNLLHLLKDPEAVIEAAFRGLKPGGVFVTSTACIGNMSWYFRIIAPVGYFLKLIPFINVFTQAQLSQVHIDAGFEIEHEWLPKKNAAVFIVARRVAPGDSGTRIRG